MDASSQHYVYLILDHHPLTSENQTVVTNILLNEQLTYYIKIIAKVRLTKYYLMGYTQFKFKLKSTKNKEVKR